jgi:hypothetical protein
MRSRAEDCRRKAEECFRLAKRARDPKVKEKYTNLARQWLALAAQFLQKQYGLASVHGSEPPSTGTRASGSQGLQKNKKLQSRRGASWET